MARSLRISPEEVRHIAILARVGVSQEDVERFCVQLSNILENFEVLKEVDTENVPPTLHSIPTHSVMREDVARSSYPLEEVLANAPRREGDFFRVRVVLEE